MTENKKNPCYRLAFRLSRVRINQEQITGAASGGRFPPRRRRRGKAPDSANGRSAPCVRLARGRAWAIRRANRAGADRRPRARDTRESGSRRIWCGGGENGATRERNAMEERHARGGQIQLRRGEGGRFQEGRPHARSGCRLCAARMQNMTSHDAARPPHDET